MYCPVCFKDTLKMRPHGVVKLAFNHKARNTSLFTYNITKESHAELLKKLKEKILDYISWYSEFKNKTPIRDFEIYSADFECAQKCKLDMLKTKVSVMGLLFQKEEVTHLLQSACEEFNVPIKLKNLQF